MNGREHEVAPAVALLRQALATARAALTEIAAISGGPIRRIAQDALDKMETD
ncbi:hypothetical protein [Paenirhodobacter hankyongi]|uniref:hypothetical protein n=1 Tax=Paenirhodobacter hankyongi TaxID=2294033 RepID=UPI001600F475|nr:hypothetical protein [Sinirhodobacter hankyongi]